MFQTEAKVPFQALILPFPRHLEQVMFQAGPPRLRTALETRNEPDPLALRHSV